MLNQIAFFAYVEYIVSLISLFVIIVLQIKIKIIEENDETPQFTNIYKLINSKIMYSQYTIIKKSSEEHYGLSIGKWFIVFISKLDSGSNKSEINKQEKNKIIVIYLYKQEWLENSFHYEEIKQDNEKDDELLKVNAFCKKDNWIDGRYELYEFTIPNSINQSQLDVIDIFYDYYIKNDKRCVGCIFGPPGTGKTTIAKLLSIKLDGILIYDYIPINSGHSWNKIINESRNNNNKPVIVLIDEVDIILENVSKGIANTNKWTQLDIKDKPSWNKWFDFKVNNTDNIIVIFTMNLSYSHLIQKLNNDTSYLRNGRCNIKIQFGNYSDIDCIEKDVIKFDNEVYHKHNLKFINS